MSGADQMPLVQVTRTYLQMTSPADLRGPVPPGASVTITREWCSAQTYRRLYAGVGTAHHWHDRDAWSDEQLDTHLAQPDVSVWVLRVEGEAAGYFELARQSDASVEIAYFGLMPAYVGRGLGRIMLSRAVQEAWRLGANRVWLHTCTLDHSAALPNYVARGFRPFRTETYLADLPAA